NHADHVEQHVPLALRPPPGDRRVGQEHAVEHQVVRAGAAHAQHVPGIGDGDAVRIQGHAEMEHGRPRLGIVVHRAGHQQMAHLAAAGEGLARSDAEAALHLLGGAGALQPVRSPARDEDQVLGRHSAEQPFGRRVLMAQAPRRRGDQMSVHG
ncbi:hypothetical protein QU38_01925, partial [Staphylococcus aureus]